MKWTDADLLEVLTELCSDIAETYDPGLKKISKRQKREVIHRTLKKFGYLLPLKELASGIAQAGPSLPRRYAPDTGWHKRAARSISPKMPRHRPTGQTRKQSYADIVSCVLSRGKETILETVESIIIARFAVAEPVRDARDQIMNNLIIGTCGLQHDLCAYKVALSLLIKDRG